MEIKRTEKAAQITGTSNSETTSTRKASTFGASDSFETANSNQSMFSAPQPESPLDKASETLEKQFNATRIGQSLIGTSSPQPVSRANDKQAEFTKASIEFKEASNPPAEDPFGGAIDDLLNGGPDGSDILGGGFTPVTPDFLKTGHPSRETKPSKPEPTLATETSQKQKFFNELLESNRMRPTSSERDEKIRNVKDHSNLFPSAEPTSSLQDEQIRNVKNHNNVPDFYPSVDPTSRVNDRQAEFTEAKAEFQELVKKREAIAEFVNFANNGNSGLDDLLNSVDIIPEKEIQTAESNRKQKELTDLLASTREALEND
jgi:hypothetical protein